MGSFMQHVTPFGLLASSVAGEMGSEAHQAAACRFLSQFCICFGWVARFVDATGRKLS